MGEIVLIFTKHENVWFPPVEGIYDLRVDCITIDKPHNSIIHICCDSCARETQHDRQSIPALYSILPGIALVNRVNEHTSIDVGFEGVKFYIQSNNKIDNIKVNCRFVLNKI